MILGGGMQSSSLGPGHPASPPALKNLLMFFCLLISQSSSTVWDMEVSGGNSVKGLETQTREERQILYHLYGQGAGH